MTALKVCLTERPLISVPSVNAVHGIAIFLTVLSFALTYFYAEDLRLLQMFRLLSRRRPPVPILPFVAHFSSLPPPASSFLL